RILDPYFAGPLLAAMLATQGLCWLFARGLGLRLGRRAVLGGWIAPMLVLAPWIAGPALLAPCNLLQEVAPGAPFIFNADREHDLLNDVIYQILPWELEVRHAFAQRRLPLWSDSLGGGSSPWSNPQAGALSPLQMAVRALPLQHHLLGALILKLLVGFQGTWLLARSAGRSRASSLLAAAGFALGGGLFSWALFPVSTTAAWVPWLAAGTVRLFRHPGRRAIATTAAIAAAILLSGHPETALFGALFAGVCGLGLRRRAAGLGRGLAAVALAAALGFGLAAPQLLPFLASVPGSQRAHDTRDPGRPTGTMRLLAPLSWFQPGYGSFVLAPASPHAFGSPYQGKFRGPFNWAEAESGYTGLVAFAGAWLALLLAARDRRAWPFLAFAGAGLLLAGRLLPLAQLLYAVPPLRVPAYPRLLPVISLALCVAGAFGMDLLLRRERARARSLAAIWASLALAALLSLAVAMDSWTVTLWALLAVAAAVAGRWPRWGPVALAAVLLLDLIPWSRSLLPVGHPSLFYPRSALMSRLLQEAGDPAAGRATGGDYLVYPGILHVYGVADFRAHDPLASAAYLHVLDLAFGFNPSMEQYFAPIRNLDHPLLDFLGVRAVVGSPAVPRYRTLPRIDDGLFDPFTLMRNPDALPRWFFPSESVAIERRSLDGWITGLTAARRVAVFRDEVGSWRPAPGGPASPDPRVVSAAPGRVVLEVPPGGEALLASSVPFSRGWSARAGGRALRTLHVDGAFLGVRLPAGASRVELRFLPPGFVTGCGAFGLSLAACFFLLLAPSSGRQSRHGRDKELK
ncbi:MAG TPA: YfhO family protein, partial [Thermoanaerobaculia bacterium]|nr:YfhO family protein [Thermoanaerobaculia bacterium]